MSNFQVLFEDWARHVARRMNLDANDFVRSISVHRLWPLLKTFENVYCIAPNVFMVEFSLVAIFLNVIYYLEMGRTFKYSKSEDLGLLSLSL